MWEFENFIHRVKNFVQTPSKPPNKLPGSQYLLESGKLLYAEWQCSDNTLFGRLLDKGFPFSEATVPHKDRIVCSANTQYILLLQISIPCGN